MALIHHLRKPFANEEYQLHVDYPERNKLLCLSRYYSGFVTQQIFTNSEGKQQDLGGGQTSARSRPCYLASECPEQVIN